MVSGHSVQPFGRPWRLADDLLLRFGSDGDAAVALVSSANSADAEVANLIVGTSDHQGTAANSLVLSNITEDGDIQMLVRDGDHSKEFLLANGDTADLVLGHGMATATIKTASGDLTLNPGDVIVASKPLQFDTGVAVTAAAYEITRDADGTNQLHFNAPSGTGFEFSTNNVPRLVIATNLMTFTSAAGDNDEVFVLANTSNASNSDAYHHIKVGGTSAGDAYTRYEILSTYDWVVGVDNGSDNFVISGGSAPGTNDALKATAATPPVITYNATHPVGTFDYVCGTCGKHDAKEFQCCGLVEWHDDVMDFRAMAIQEEGALDYFEKIGVVVQSVNKFDGRDEVFMTLGADFAFVGSMAFQNRVRMDARFAEIEHRLEAAGV